MRSSLAVIVVLLAAGCGASNHDPVSVATRYMTGIVVGDAGHAYRFLSTSDRASADSARFEQLAFDSDIGLDRLATTVDSARLLESSGDSAAVGVFTTGPDVDAVRRGAASAADPPRRVFVDTVRMVREPEPKHWYSPVLSLVRKPGVWRVWLGLKQRARIEQLATPLRGARDDVPISDLARYAHAYLAAAEQTPTLAQPADLDRARDALRTAAVADSLQFRLRVNDSAPGARYLSGVVANPTSMRVGIVHLLITDVRGAQEQVEVWGVDAGGSTQVGQPTHLRAGPLEITVNTLDLMGG
ncbi:MAG: hypothetical protein P8099_18025 [Gemmatimonadota bacterium]